jgi:hypothetical protein
MCQKPEYFNYRNSPKHLINIFPIIPDNFQLCSKFKKGRTKVAQKGRTKTALTVAKLIDQACFWSGPRRPCAAVSYDRSWASCVIDSP